MKQFYKVSRWLHVYTSTVLFALFVLFSFTGLTLNHADWFGQDYQDGEVSWQLPAQLKQKVSVSLRDARGWSPPLDELIAHVATKQPHLGPVKDIAIDGAVGEISFDYPLPAGYALVIVEEASGQVILEYRKGGIVSVLNDLHKGRHTGVVWSVLIDVVAIVMMLFSITGMIILFQNKKRKTAGLVL